MDDVAEKYVVGTKGSDLLGNGAFGTVKKGRAKPNNSNEEGQEVAIKVISKKKLA
jgi:serine/threonine protein kinase